MNFQNISQVMILNFVIVIIPNENILILEPILVRTKVLHM